MFEFLIPLVLVGTALYFVMRTRRPGAAPTGTVEPMVPDTAPVAGFRKRPLLNTLEMSVYLSLCRWAETRDTDLHVSAQVAMGEFIGHQDYQQFRRINTKRVDFALFESTGSVKAVVEYDGRGHWGKTANEAQQAQDRDQLKNQVLREAGIPLIRLTERMGPRDIMKEMDLALVEYMPDAKAEELVAARTARR